MSHQNIQKASIEIGTRVRFTHGGVQYTGTVTATAINVNVSGGIAVTVKTDTGNTLVVALASLRYA